MLAARTSRAAGLVFCLALSASCGGGGGPTQPLNTPASVPPPAPAPAANVLAVAVTSGPPSNNDVNTLFTSVTVCVPGSTTECQTIDNIEVDTASFGLRLMSSVLTVGLPVQAAGAGNSLVECTEFADGYSWGPVALADVQIAGETASSVPVQVIGSPSFPNVPSDCVSSSTGPEQDTVAQFGANGLLGVGVFAQDCGANCAGTVEPASYYSCSQTQCTGTMAPLTSQVTNPVALFATDNNGVIIELPAVPAQGASTVSGSLIFGIDTQTNNKSGSQTILSLDAALGQFTTVFNGQNLNASFLDTGSNGLYFEDDAIPQCSSSDFSGFYCPADTESFGATLQGQDAGGALVGVTIPVTFSVASAESLQAGEPTYLAFSSLAGTTSMSGGFDWGLPFYYGRTVYTVIQGAQTSVGTGPYVAF